MSTRRLALIPALATLSLSALGGLGCSAAPPKQADEPDPIAAPEPVDEPVASEDPDPKPVDAPLSPEPSDTPKPDPGADDYEINIRDCEALARAYAGAWLNDEKATLDKKKLKKEQHDEVMAQIQEDSQGMFDNYLDQCGKTVGTTYLRSQLDCAIKAKTMKKFDECMSSPFGK